MTTALLLGAIAATLLVPSPQPVQRARYLMGTLCTAVADAPSGDQAGAALGRALDEIARLEQIMSSWRPDSELMRLNAAAGGEPIACSAELHAVVDSAVALARVTDGAFDPTVEPLVRAWDLRGQGRVPGADEFARALALTGWWQVELDGSRVHLRQPGMGLDLGGIGKGFALDRAAALLASQGVERALLNLGGEIVVRSSGEPWEIAVAHPADRLRPAVTLSIANGGISTSGQSERGVVVRGKRYGHILDPRRGVPVPLTASVTVVAPSATRSDAVAKALLVMGRDSAANFAHRHPELGVLWLEPGGRQVRAWKWNLTPEPRTAAADRKLTVRWMN